MECVKGREAGAWPQAWLSAIERLAEAPVLLQAGVAIASSLVYNLRPPLNLIR